MCLKTTITTSASKPWITNSEFANSIPANTKSALLLNIYHVVIHFPRTIIACKNINLPVVSVVN